MARKRRKLTSRNTLEAGMTITAPGVLEEVVILGAHSLNPTDYTPGYMASAVNFYEGAKCYLNHPKKGEGSRKVEDVFGKFEGVYHDTQSEKLKAKKFIFNPEHSYAKPFAWAAENAPELLGFSHNAMVMGKKCKKTKRFQAEECVAVSSVDLVGDPGTTKGLFESFNSSEDSANEFIESALKVLSLSPDNRVKLVALIEGLETTNPTQKTEDLKGIEMDPKDVDLKWLQENAPHLLKQHDDNKGEAKKMAALEAENLKLKTEADKAQAVAKVAAQKVAAQEACKLAKLPEGAVSEFFIGQLSNMDAEVMKSAIEDRVKLLGIRNVTSSSRNTQQGKSPAELQEGASKTEYKALNEQTAEEFTNLVTGQHIS